MVFGMGLNAASNHEPGMLPTMATGQGRTDSLTPGCHAHEMS